MKNISKFIVKQKYWFLGIFLILIGLSCFLMTRVNINYNLMKYLDSDSTSTVALTKMEDEFGSIGQCQIEVTNISFEESEKIKTIIEEVDGVSSIVSAKDEDDRDYYNKETNDALYKVFLESGNFDTASYKILDNIRKELKDYDYALNGGSVESQFLTEALEKDMIIILIVVIVVVFLILAFTSASWFEPVLFLIIAGGAILINMGTNIILNGIPYIGNSMSFITKSIAAVMQLALSMDYAIVLLHAYRQEKEKGLDNNEAMVNALTKSFAPVSSSSITTIAGLVALMFMSFSIGFDVGLVLAKGILISLLSVFLFMPSLLLLFDKVIVKTSHKPLDKIVLAKIEAHNEKKRQQNKKVHTIASFQRKTKILIPVLALIIIVVGAIFNYKSEYSFVLEASTDANSTINLDEKKITKEFGTQNTLVILLPKNGNDRNSLKDTEEEIIDYLNNYEYKNKKVINSAQGFSTYGVYDNLTAEEFTEKYLDEKSYNANLRGIQLLYSFMEKEGIITKGEDDTLKANVYDVIEYAANNKGAIKITESSQALINKINSVYQTKLTAEEFAAVNNMSYDVVNNVYTTLGQDKLTTYEVLKFVVDNNYAELAFENVQNTVDSSYQDLVDNHVFNEDGTVNETTVGAMKTYISAVDNGLLDKDDQIVQATYTKYKKVVMDMNKSLMMSTYPFITEDTATLLLNGNETIPNYLLIQAISANKISKTYGVAMQQVINAKYNEIPSKDKELTREEIIYNYGIDDETLDELFNEYTSITNEILFKELSQRNYFLDEEYQNNLDSQFKTNYEAFNNFESDNYVRIIFNFNMPKSGDDSFKAINEITDHLYKEYDGIQVVSETFVYSQIKDVFNNDIILVNLISFIAILAIIAITFKSYFIPILLTVLIQGAIWVTMGISTMFGNDIFFICYIVVMCVQMGATIDYGILLTNNYIENRKKYDVETSMSLALSNSITTILTSGSILVLATLIIGLVSKVSIVSDLGLLLSRGCLISVLMIIFVLPQCLILLDKVIEKTSFKTKFYHEDKEEIKDNQEEDKQ